LEEIFVPVVMLKHGNCEGEIFFAGSRAMLMDSLEANEFTEFFVKDEQGNRVSDVLIRSDDIDVLEIEVQDEIAEEIRNIREAKAKVVDITGVLEKVGRSEVPPLKESRVHDPIPLMNEIDPKTWSHAKLEPIGRALMAMLAEAYPKADGKAEKLFKELIYLAMDAAEAIKFFLDAYDSARHGDKIIARCVSAAIKGWAEALAFDDLVILNTLKDSERRDFVLDDVFTTALDGIEAGVKIKH